MYCSPDTLGLGEESGEGPGERWERGNGFVPVEGDETGKYGFAEVVEEEDGEDQ